VYSVTLYCSDPACDAIFEADGSLDAVAAAICPFCGCTLGEMTCVPCGEAEEADEAFDDLELWLIAAPAGRRLRRRRRSRKRLPKAA
jgi:hypothetical protein